MEGVKIFLLDSLLQALCLAISQFISSSLISSSCFLSLLFPPLLPASSYLLLCSTCASLNH